MGTRTVTLAELRDGVADRADIVISDGARHSTSAVNARINRAIQRWLLMIADAGDDTNLVTSRTSTATGTTRDASNWALNQYVVQPPGLLYVRGLDVWSNNTPIAMLQADELERNDSQLTALWWANGSTGMPVFFRLGGKNANGDSLIQIFPWADAVYTIDIRYIPAHVDLANDDDTIEILSGGDEWIVNDVSLQTLIRDNPAGTDMEVISGWNSKIESELRFSLACRGATRRQDTVSRTELLRRLSIGGWRMPL